MPLMGLTKDHLRNPIDNRNNAALALSELLEKRTGTFISAEALIDLFRTDWQKVSVCAHTIHDVNLLEKRAAELPKTEGLSNG